ncbi:aminopeptidase P family protein [Lentilitoribacter sp. Alg239-R112]|uniref:aminopeptidase P family protein n=1 Tax=Lentilitoribacter sp. Alg239-R112 TaxID=2305987 RepID=UPI0013A6971F|nr:aminopeptidase P family protein [Lentilitoribacter sp. Alg239-R112]
MFQKFVTVSKPETASARVVKLRNLFDELDVDAILVPRSDEYLGEYVPTCAERLAWLTSFTGSAGTTLVLRDKAIIFTDGRYTSQVSKQCDLDIFSIEDLITNPPSKWIETNTSGLRLGLDPWTLPGSSIKNLEKALNATQGEIVTLRSNPVDQIWNNKPEEPSAKISIQPEKYSGQLAKDKIATIRLDLKTKESDAVIIADPLSVCWIFNIRGQDVAHTPLTLSRAIIYKDSECKIFIDAKKLDMQTEAYLTQLAEIHPIDEFEIALKHLGKDNAHVLLDQQISSHAISTILTGSGCKVINKSDPALKPRAIKNKAEIDGAIEAHKVDGAALVYFLAWLDAQTPEQLDEIKVATKLENTREEIGQKFQMPLREISFDTISGSGPHAAIIHYRVDETSNRQLKSGEMMLIDSGGQYEAGTTDITRTIGFGNVPEEQKRFFTLVLKGMINISLLKFPKGTRGVDIDAFARIALWKAGVDYAHGTGHGVGSYLSVHEGPQSISKRSMVELETGMIVSNEPGYYRDDAFGIRIENLVTVDAPQDIDGGEIAMLGFNTLTLCPIDRNLILPNLLSSDESEWLNSYHQTVYDELSPLIENNKTLEWLKSATAKIH